MRVLQYLWFHFITSATSWLPDLAAFPAPARISCCGLRSKVAEEISRSRDTSPSILRIAWKSAGCLHCHGLLAARRREKSSWRTRCNSDRTPCWSRETTRRSMDPIDLDPESRADSHWPGCLGRGSRDGHEGCGRRTRRCCRSKFRGHARYSAVWNCCRCSSARYSEALPDRSGPVRALSQGSGIGK